MVTYLTLLANQTRPYEVNKGESNRIVDSWVEKISHKFLNNRGYIGWAMKKKIFLISQNDF